MRNVTKICSHVWAWWYQMYLLIVWCTRVKYKYLLLRYLIKLLDLQLRLDRCSQKAPSLSQQIDVIFTSRNSLSNQLINHLSTQPRIRVVISAVMFWLRDIWTTRFKYICLIAFIRCAWYTCLQKWQIDCSRNVLCSYYLTWLTLILRHSRTGKVCFYTSTSNKRAARTKLYTKSLTRDLKLMYSRLTLVRISINL